MTLTGLFGGGSVMGWTVVGIRRETTTELLLVLWKQVVLPAVYTVGKTVKFT